MSGGISERRTGTENRETLVAASLLSANFSDISSGVRSAEKAGADWIHLDVMDGSFVPVITSVTKMVSDVRGITKLPLDVHLMIEKPENHIKSFIEAGTDHHFHLEATTHPHRVLGAIRDLGALAGISIVPSTPASMISEILDIVDIVLVMTVNPGFGGAISHPKMFGKS